MATPDCEREPVEVLASEFTERRRRGEHPAVAEYTAKYPQWAEEIRELFPTIAAVEGWKLQQEQTIGKGSALVVIAPQRLGDFRILREIGRGGMGIVYEAEQESLGRRVALKILPDQLLLAPKHLQRFEREAQTAARLHHTNIVPVFGVGQQSGYHYYVMQLIRGVGLDAVLGHLERTPSGARPQHDAPSAGNADSDARPAGDVVGVARRLLEKKFPGSGPCDRSSGDGDTSGSAAGKDESAPAAAEPSQAEATTVALGRDSPQATPTAPYSIDRATTHADPSDGLRYGAQYWQSVARIGIQASRALDYAHGQGTLHRDVKPANLLLDAQGAVWVADFGLAKAIEDDAVTQTGDIVGTLRYMAPEQFSGRLDARSDIYSLGITLYELATLHPAFQDTGRSDLIRKIIHEEPTRPRKRMPQIPRDLETIIVKSIAREPAARYQSAAELAADLQRFLEDRPVRARRVTPAERFWRWCRRNPVVASLTSAVVLLLALVTAVATAGYVQTRSAWRSEWQQRQKAEATTELAMQALDKIFQQFAPNRIVDTADLTLEDSEGQAIEIPVQPVLSKESAMLLEHMLIFYDRLAEQGGNNARLRRKVADANRRVGDIRQRLGHYEQARAAYERSVELYQRLTRQSPEDAGLLVQIAGAQNALGNVYHAMDQKEQEIGAHRKALELLNSPPSTSARSPELRYELARTYYFLGREGPPPDGRPPGPMHGRLGPPPGRLFPGLGPPHPGGGRRGRGPMPLRSGSGPPGPEHAGCSEEANMHKAIALLEELIAERPTVPDYRHLLARCYRDMHPGFFIFSRRAALEANNKAIEILERLVGDFPDVPDYRYDLSQTYAEPPPPQQGPFVTEDVNALAEERFRRALKISKELVAEHPNIPEYTASQADIHRKLAGVLQRAGRREDAEASLRESVRLQSLLAQRFPDVAPYTIQLARLESSLARMLREGRQADEARALLESSVARLEQLLAADPQSGHLLGTLAWHYMELASLLRGTDESEAAADAQRRAGELRQKARRGHRGPFRWHGREQSATRGLPGPTVSGPETAPAGRMVQAPQAPYATISRRRAT